MTRSYELLIHWPRRAVLRPEVGLDAELPLDECEVDVVLSRAYAWLDDCELARARGEPEPSSLAVLTEAQRATVDELVATWPQIVEDLGRCYPASVRSDLEWGGARITRDEHQGRVWVELTGYTTGTGDNAYSEHGLGAWLLGSHVMEGGDRGLRRPGPAHSPPNGPTRPNPAFRELSAEAVQGHIRQGNFASLARAMKEADSVEGGRFAVTQQILDWLWSHPPLQAAAHVAGTGNLMLRGHTTLDETLVGRQSLVVLRALVDHGVYQLPKKPLSQPMDADLARRWIALGAPLDDTCNGKPTTESPLYVHRHSAELVDLLLAAGADVRGLVDEYDVPFAPLGSEVLEVLHRHDPERFPLEDHHRPAPQPSSGSRTVRRRAKATPAGTLAQWETRGWIDVEPDADREALDRLLTALLAMDRPFDQVMDALLRLPGVEEVYLSDAELAAALHRG